MLRRKGMGLLLLITIMLIPCLNVLADDEINEAVYDTLRDLDSQISDFSFYDFTSQLMDNKISFEIHNILGYIWQMITKEVKTASKSLYMLIAPILLFSVLSALTLKKNGEGVSQAAFTACYAIICGVCVYVFYDMVSLAKDTIFNIDVLTKYLVPVLYTLLTTMGNFSQATMIQPTVILISQIMVIIIHKIIFPLILLSFALTVTDHITVVSKLKNFAELINKVIKWTMVFIITLFVAIITAQNILGHSFDAVAIKSSKFALSTLIPVVGGALSEGVESMGTSFMLIKNTTGIAGIAGVIMVAIIPVIKIYTVSFMFHIVSAIIQPVSDERFSNVLKCIGRTTSLLGVCVISMAFVFIISTAVVLSVNTIPLMI